MRNTTNIGNIGFAKVLSKFVLLGVPVYTPFAEGYTADLVAEFNGRLNKIQVKTTEKVHEEDCMKWRITRLEGYHGNNVSYNPEDVDYFAVYCIENDILCLVPFDLSPKTVLIIRTDNYDGSKTKTMKFASDFAFEKIIN